MSTDYVASNGLTVEKRESGYGWTLGIRNGGGRLVLTVSGYEALAEMFEHDRVVAAKPWLSATSGEAWVVTDAYGKESVYIAASAFGSNAVFENDVECWSLDSPHIHSARRIFPEVDDGASDQG